MFDILKMNINIHLLINLIRIINFKFLTYLNFSLREIYRH